MSCSTKPFGTTADGRDVQLITLTNSNAMTATVTDLGACLVSAYVPTRTGELIDVVLAHADVQGYENNPMGFGASIGRCANRIADASFELDGKQVDLAANEGKNSLHSGPNMWHQRLWDVIETGDDHVTFGLTSEDGDQGFPGKAEVRATYTLSENNELTVHYEVTLSERSVVNMTNHVYWNLNGHASGDILGHQLSIDADGYLPTDEGNIPLGEIASVEGTIFDLRNPHRLDTPLAQFPRGYDNNFCLRETEGVRPFARLVGDETGIALEISSDSPGVQVYQAGWLDDMSGKDGAAYGQFSGIALEAQIWPDAIHHSDWASPIFGPERPFSQTIVFAFSVEK